MLEDISVNKNRPVTEISTLPVRLDFENSKKHVCSTCAYFKKSHPRSGLYAYYCTAILREPVPHPVTGHTVYLPKYEYETQTGFCSTPHPLCSELNSDWNCRFYKAAIAGPGV